jgi:putative spermidine/putrescine transport system ATP-binding protein
MALADLIVVMTSGRVEQKATPHEVFIRPATEFVARFIGGHNIIKGSGGLVAVRTDRLRIGRLNGQGTPDRCTVATVRDVEYQGTHVQIGLTSDIAPELVATVPERIFFADQLSPGDQVAVSWSEDDAYQLLR